MDGVPDPERAIRNVWCYGKGQSILVKKPRKKSKLGKSKNKIAQKGKAANNLVKNSSKTAGKKFWGLIRVHQPQSLGRLGRIQEEHVRKIRHTKIRPCFRN